MPPLVRGVKPAVVLSLDGDDASIAVNLLPLLHAEGTPGARRHALCTLSATFQLLRVCEAAASADGLEGVDAVLGCPLYLFEPQLLETFEQQSTAVRETICLALFYSVDWLRELVSAFCSQNDRTRTPAPRSPSHPRSPPSTSPSISISCLEAEPHRPLLTASSAATRHLQTS